MGLINMNGRLYDPKLHRFLQPDNLVQEPFNTQNYNKYAYVLNNPFKYTDPSGEEAITFGAVVIIGAVIAATTYTLTALLADVPFNVGGLLKATFIGAASSAVTFGIGSAAGTITNFYVRAAVSSVMHGAFQGSMTAISGGKFWSGFAAGALSSIAASAFGSGFNHEGLDANGEMINVTKVWNGAGSLADSGIGLIAFGTVSGGAGAAITDGNFWQGAVTGLFVSGLNHAMHQIDPPAKKVPNLKEANKFYSKNKNSKAIYTVDASTVDLNFVDTKGWVIDDVYMVQTLYKSENGLVFGKLNLQYKGNNQVKIMDDFYDFNLEFSNPLKVSEFLSPRNIFTGIAQLYAGNGTSFTFKFSGLNTIKNNSVKVTPQSNLYKQYP